MKLKNLGKTYTLDSENNFILDKDIDLSQEVINFVDIILDYFRKNINIEIHSAYLRGSCLERNVIDKNTMDIDMVIVYENESFKSHSFLTQECIDEIMKIMKSSYGFSIYPDIGIDHLDFFLDKSQSHLRFLCKKVYGEKDLSILKKSKSEMISWIDEKYDYWVDKGIFNIRQDKKNIDCDVIRSHIKCFFRNLSVRFMIENGKFSRGVYECYKVMVEQYPNYSDDLNDIMNLFLNIEEYSEEKIIMDLNKIIFISGSIQSKKPYRIKVTKK